MFNIAWKSAIYHSPKLENQLPINSSPFWMPKWWDIPTTESWLAVLLKVWPLGQQWSPAPWQLVRKANSSPTPDYWNRNSGTGPTLCVSISPQVTAQVWEQQLDSNENDQTTTPCKRTGESHKQREQKMEDTKEDLLGDPISTKLKGRQKPPVLQKSGSRSGWRWGKEAPA